jgi:putative YhbY family RNA-binding protein
MWLASQLALNLFLLTFYNGGMNATTPFLLATMPSLPLTSADRKELKASAHHLNPVIIIGDKGLTPSVMKEIAGALKAHALIKIKVMGDDRDARKLMLEQITSELHCGAVQSIGKQLVVYKPKPQAKPKEHLPKKMAADGLTEKPRKRFSTPRKVEEEKKPFRYTEGYREPFFEEPTRPGRAPRLGSRTPTFGARPPRAAKPPTGSGRR